MTEGYVDGAYRVGIGDAYLASRPITETEARITEVWYTRNPRPNEVRLRVGIGITGQKGMDFDSIVFNDADLVARMIEEFKVQSPEGLEGRAIILLNAGKTPVGFKGVK